VNARFVNLTVHFIRARSNVILSCSSELPRFIYYATCGMMEREKRIVGGGGRELVSPH